MARMRIKVRKARAYGVKKRPTLKEGSRDSQIPEVEFQNIPTQTVDSR